MFIYMCTYIHTYTYTYIHIHIYIYVYICVYTCIYWAILCANAQLHRMLEGKSNRGRVWEYNISVYMCIYMYILGYIGREYSAPPYA